MTSKLWQVLVITALLACIHTQGQCPSGQYADANNLCQPCPANCATCISATFCQTCTTNTFQVVGNGISECRTCSVVQIGCSICLSPTSCQTCQVGFVLESSKCISCVDKINNCSSCQIVNNTATCLQCRYPYILSNNMCVSSTVDAITAGAQTVFVNTSAGSVAQVKLDSGNLVNATLSAQGCNQYQVFQFGRCIRAIFQCIVYQSNGLCSVCGNGWLRTIYGDCSIEKYQLQCENGFWLDSANDRCVKVDVSCDWFYPNNGSCFNCSTNYTLQGAICVPNKQCTSRQFFSNGACVSVPLACLSFLSDGTCTACSAGNTLSNGICSPSIVAVRAFNDCVFPCRTCFFGQLGFCFSCSFGYQLKDNQYGTCVPIIF